jgi:hypothetical protein
MEVLPNPLRQDEGTLKPWIDPHQLKQHQGIWYKDGRTVITGDTRDKREVIHVYHDSLVYGHPGISKTVQLTKRNHWWPGVTCRWHARLDVSWVGAVANSAQVTVLCTDPEPLLA